MFFRKTLKNFKALSLLNHNYKRNYLEWSNKLHILDSWTPHELLKEWLIEKISLFQPARIHLCDGSDREYNELINLQINIGTIIKLNEKIRPNSYLVRSDKEDVARLEDSTFICSDSSIDSGPTNNWRDPLITTNEMTALFENSMKGRTMYVIPFCMGPLNSKMSFICVQITDSPYVVTSMKIMTRMGSDVIKLLGDDKEFIPCVHSVGKPLSRLDMDCPWPSNKKKLVVHFPEQQRIWSFGSGYGGNALLGKKSFALRIASCIGKESGWLAEHMLIIGITNPKGIKKYFAAAFPSACGKTNMALMSPKLKGWKIECVGDDIAWIHINPNDGKLYAINPEAGFFGVAPGTSMKTNPNMMKSLNHDTIFTNVGLTNEGDVWWEEMTENKPKKITTWLRHEWTNGDEHISSSHPNARFCTSLKNCNILDSNWNNPKGVPLEAIIFGGRRSNVVPLVYEANNWNHGVFIGSVMSSETTAAAAGRRGILRQDPFAMRSFCGYNMADYFKHWLSFVENSPNPKMLPKIFHVNWFRKVGNKIAWPGFGNNIRVLKWIFERCSSTDNNNNGTQTAIGIVPKVESIDMSDLDLSKETLAHLLKVDHQMWRGEVERYKEFFSIFAKNKIPKVIMDELDILASKTAKVTGKSNI